MAADTIRSILHRNIMENNIMSYIQNILSEDEKLIWRAHLHWVYMAKGFLWLFLFSIIGILFDYFLWQNTGRYTAPESVHILGRNIIINISLFEWICVAGGIMLFLVYYLKYISTEILLTDKRILYKTGLIAVKAEELELQEIKEEKVNHGWFGYTLGYGTVHLDCRFVDDLDLPVIGNPTGFIKALYKERSHNKEAAVVAT